MKEDSVAKDVLTNQDLVDADVYIKVVDEDGTEHVLKPMEAVDARNQDVEMVVYEATDLEEVLQGKEFLEVIGEETGIVTSNDGYIMNDLEGLTVDEEGNYTYTVDSLDDLLTYNGLRNVTKGTGTVINVVLPENNAFVLQDDVNLDKIEDSGYGLNIKLGEAFKDGDKVSIDLNGHSLTISNGVDFNSTESTFSQVDIDVTISNGEIVNKYGLGGTFRVDNFGDYTFDNVTFNSPDSFNSSMFMFYRGDKLEKPTEEGFSYSNFLFNDCKFINAGLDFSQTAEMLYQLDLNVKFDGCSFETSEGMNTGTAPSFITLDGRALNMIVDVIDTDFTFAATGMIYLMDIGGMSSKPEKSVKSSLKINLDKVFAVGTAVRSAYGVYIDDYYLDGFDLETSVTQSKYNAFVLNGEAKKLVTIR